MLFEKESDGLYQIRNLPRLIQKTLFQFLEPHPAVLRAYTCFCTQGSLLGDIMGCHGINLDQSYARQALYPLSLQPLIWVSSFGICYYMLLKIVSDEEQSTHTASISPFLSLSSFVMCIQRHVYTTEQESLKFFPPFQILPKSSITSRSQASHKGQHTDRKIQSIISFFRTCLFY